MNRSEDPTLTTTSAPTSAATAANARAAKASAPAAPARPARRVTRKAAPVRRGSSLFGPGIISALAALWANRLRSLLTILGVIVGVAAVIVAVSITQGASNAINSRVAGLGTNVLLVSPGAASTGGVRQAAGSQQTLTRADADAVGALPHVANASPVLAVSAQLVAGAQNWNTRIQGVYPTFQSIGNWTVAEGNWFSATDEGNNAQVIVLGQTVVQNLFTPTGTDPLGQTVLVNGQQFQVVGVLQAKGAAGASNQDDVAFVPFSTANQRLNNSQYVNQIEAQADSADDVNTVQTEITSLLEQRHQIAAGGTDDFTVRSATQFVQTAQQFAQTLTFLLVGIAAISLLVGGIGIMNIMLVSVTERTREIGVRMAIGARRRDVRNQFLLESATLSVVGGVIGIAIGLVGGYALSVAAGLPFGVNPLALVLAFGVSAIIGVGFGLYPAISASRLDPIVALRTE